MDLDTTTLMVAGSFVAAVGSLLLLASWWQLRAPELLWWSVAQAVNGLGAGIFTAGLLASSPLLVAIGSGGSIVSLALYLTGTRAFFRRPPVVGVALLAIAFWMATLLLPPTLPNVRLAVGVSFLAGALLLAGAVAELWRGRRDALSAWNVVFGLFVLQTLFVAAGAFGIAFGFVTMSASASLLSWLGLFHFERLVFLVGTSAFLAAMTREREHARTLTDARLDALTGVPNRGAFFVQADRVLRRARVDGLPVSVIAFDLDHFKHVNDTFGHAAGDEVLRAFSTTAVQVLRPGDMFARIGGEEFAAILPGAGGETAFVVAERLRHAFDIAPKGVDLGPLQATVSAGLAVARPEDTLDTVLEAADRALYRAKAFGRNRVERAANPPRSDSNIIRFA